jgi:hypothetical protein
MMTLPDYLSSAGFWIDGKYNERTGRIRASNDSTKVVQSVGGAWRVIHVGAMCDIITASFSGNTSHNLIIQFLKSL